MAQWFDANRSFNRAVRDQAAALIQVYGIEGAHVEAQRLRRKATTEEAQLFAYNVEVLTAEAAGISLDRPGIGSLGPEPPIWALPFLSPHSIAVLQRLLGRILGAMRVRRAPAVGSLLQTYQESRRDHPLTLGLTPRQIECLRWAAEGKSSADIAGIVGISARTVDEHLDHACAKLGVRTRTQAVKIAATKGLLGPNP
jgi:DNA-binding CsgD family transcriptional regulator